jgi:hypothetical protein
MKTKEMKFLFAGLLILALSYAGYRWDKSRNLDNYYVDQFCLDWELQASKGDRLHNGPIIEEATREMKELGYDPYEIQQIMFKGFDKALEKERKHKSR